MVTADGKILGWKQKNFNAAKTLLVSDSNQYQCIAHSIVDRGSKLAVAGKNPCVEIYDDEKMQ